MELTLDDLRMLPCGQRVRVSAQAVKWAIDQAPNWECTPRELIQKMAQSFAQGTWPYEYVGVGAWYPRLSSGPAVRFA